MLSLNRTSNPSTRYNLVRTVVAVILVVILLVGIGISIFGYQEYQTLIRGNFPPPTPRFGLVIFSSPWTRLERNAQVEMKIYDIVTTANTAELNVVCTFSTNDTTSTKLLFGMQLPHNFSDLVVNVDMQSTSRAQGQGGGLGNPFFLAQDRGVDKANGLFYFWVIIDRSDSSLSPWDKFRFNATMTLYEPLYQNSYTTFELITQFDSSFPTYPSSAAPAIPAETFSYLTPATSDNYLLEIAQPENSRMGSTPSPDAIVFSGRRTWYLWNMPENRKALEFFGMAILTDFEMLNLVDVREGLIFRDGLFLGVGVPAVMTSILELLREFRGQSTQVEGSVKKDEAQMSKPGRRGTRREK